jgi:hypothetical protein
MAGDGKKDNFSGGDVNIAAGRSEKADFVDGEVSERSDQRMQRASEDSDHGKDMTIYDTTNTTTTTSTAAVESSKLAVWETFCKNLKADGEYGADNFARDRAALARKRRQVCPHRHMYAHL